MTLHNKAIRDRIPEIIEKSGSKANVKRLSDEEFLEEMEKKLDEEVSEYHENKSIEEIADIIEVIERIAELRGTSAKELRKIKDEKSEKRGRFEKNLFLIETNDSWYLMYVKSWRVFVSLELENNEGGFGIGKNYNLISN